MATKTKKTTPPAKPAKTTDTAAAKKSRVNKWKVQPETPAAPVIVPETAVISPKSSNGLRTPRRGTR